MSLLHSKPRKRQSQLQQTTIFAKSFLIFGIFKLSYDANYKWRFMGYFFAGCADVSPDCNDFWIVHACRDSYKHCIDNKCLCKNLHGNNFYICLQESTQ